MGFFDEFRAVMGEVVEAVVGGVTEAAQTTSEQAKEVAGDLKEEVRYSLEAAGPHLRRGIGAAAFAAGWVVREGRRQVEILSAEFRQPADDEAPIAAADAPDEALPEYEERQLTEAEEVWARQVFRDTLPYGITYVSNALGLHGKPYTVPHPWHLGAFVLHLGPEIYQNPIDPTNRLEGQRGDAVFIHALMHVWQGVHRWREVDYAFRALTSPFVPGAAEGYRYEAGKPWADYNPDQQAELVRDWYLSGMPHGGVLFPYIRDHVWAGVP
jgi:hypothetical protein